jgi:ribonuclease HI
MSAAAPHFLLTIEAFPAAAYAGSAACQAAAGAADAADFTSRNDARGRWRFLLSSPGGEACLEAADEEDETSSERLELLALVRGLEALEQPSRVTILAASRHLKRGLELGLSQWRENDWHWERYGQMTPVKNRDLWRRIDRLLEIHQVQCRAGRLEKADDLAPPPPAAVFAFERRHPGEKLRVDPPVRRRKKSEFPSAKHSAGPNPQARQPALRTGRGRRWAHWLANVFRAACWVVSAALPWLRASRLPSS